MRKKEIKEFLDKFEPPFRIITKKGTIITCKGIVKLSDYTLTVKDKFNMMVQQEIDDISTLQTFNGFKLAEHSESTPKKEEGLSANLKQSEVKKR